MGKTPHWQEENSASAKKKFLIVNALFWRDFWQRKMSGELYLR